MLCELTGAAHVCIVPERPDKLPEEAGETQEELL